jgi:hypothetical protein
VTLQRRQPDEESGLERHHPEESALEPRAEAPKDWRAELESPRWRAAPLRNPEMNPTRTWVSLVFWGVLAALTFVLLLVGYATGFWP